MTGPFRWSEKSGRFRAPNGRFLSSRHVRSMIDRTLAAHTRAVAQLTEQLRQRAVSLAEWERRMRAEIKGIHLYSAMAAKGGRVQLTSADFGRIGSLVKRQYRYLRRFADDIQNGLALDGRVVRRTALYAQAGRGTLESFRRTEMQRRGFTEVRSVLRPAEHCNVCVEQSRKGWQSPTDFVPIGARDCLTSCRCFAEWRNPGTGEIAG